MDLEKLEQEAKKEYLKIGTSHDWEHILRVKNNAKIIGQKEDADLNIILPAAILHDLGRLSGKEKKHSQDTTIAKKILNTAQYNEILANKIVNCIKTHSYDEEIQPETLEAKVVFDADKIDSYGFLGVARFFSLTGEEHLSINEAISNAFERISALGKIGGFLTKTGKEIGFKKVKRSIIFYYLLMKELGNSKNAQKIESLVKEKFGEQTVLELKTIGDKI